NRQSGTRTHSRPNSAVRAASNRLMQLESVPPERLVAEGVEAERLAAFVKQCIGMGMNRIGRRLGRGSVVAHRTRRTGRALRQPAAPAGPDASLASIEVSSATSFHRIGGVSGPGFFHGQPSFLTLLSTRDTRASHLEKPKRKAAAAAAPMRALIDLRSSARGRGKRVLTGCVFVGRQAAGSG